MIKFTIYGEPVAKGRAKFCVRGGHAIAYTPKATREAEGDFRSQSLPYRPKEIITGAIGLSIVVYKVIPKSFSKKKAVSAEAGEIMPITRPDFDNYAKLVCDSLNGVFWKDDGQITDCAIHKRYSKTPRIEIVVDWEANGENDKG
jgi:Holliday junction resolvase RusA-like endonuclease